jgi:hypothetical protein
MAAWHPSPPELRSACRGLSSIAEEEGMSLEEVCILWAMESWMEEGKKFGTTVGMCGFGLHGVTVVGVSSVAELEQTYKVWQKVLSMERRELQLKDVDRIVRKKMWPALGQWKDYTWESPGKDFARQPSNT